jgi:hypothetical protein
MREYMTGRESDLVRFCDGHSRLEARWIQQRLGELVAQFDDYQQSAERGGPFVFFDLLFTPDAQERFGIPREERRENARQVATALMPRIRPAIRRPGLAAFEEQPGPQIVVGRGSGARGDRRVVVTFHENEFDLMWSISEWD